MLVVLFQLCCQGAPPLRSGARRNKVDSCIVWTCCIILTRFSTAVSGSILGSRPNISTPARLSTLHCVVGRLALCLCLYFTETSCCAAVGTQAVLT
ncbi:hypothetical protein Q7C36_007929 [Tachysurus vachellii]|uniref:Uncharacterized protein n=1 Tax=Tachysurus vachellii TaxID=175792 RepID=A0AA88NB48_TACVA|nr:hypothetical protein Q7C36_007929 [Tachysurus vachellii]